MYIFLETYNLLKVSEEESENHNRQTTSEIEAVILKSCQKKKSSPPDSFTGKFYQRVTEELTPILKLFQKIQNLGEFWPRWRCR